jgi:hypothetical protein
MKIDVSISASPIQNEEGETIGISAIVRDVSEGKKRRSENWKQVVLAIDPCSNITLNPS